MANTIRIKRSTGSSAPSTLENAELAFAEGNEIGYIGIGTGGAGGSAKFVIVWLFNETEPVGAAI